MSKKMVIMTAVFFTALLLLALVLVSGCGSSSGDAADTAQLQQLQRLFAVRIEKQNQEVDFQTVDQDDSSLASGTTETRQQGAKGVRQVSYAAIYLFGNEFFRLPIETKIVTPPVNQIVSLGTAQPSTGGQGGQTADGTANAEYQAEKAAALARLQAQVQADYEKNTAAAQHVIQCMGRIPVPPGC